MIIVVAKYQELADRLRADIYAERWAPGDTLPNIDVLAANVGVAIDTVRSAIEVLEREGLVRRIRRRGTVVQDWRAVPVKFNIYREVLEPGGTRGPWETACAAAGVNGTMVPIEVEREDADAEVAAALGLPDEARFTIRRSRQLHIDDLPIGTSTAWIPYDLARDTPLAGPGKIEGGVYGALTALGHRPTVAEFGWVLRWATPGEMAEFRPRAGLVNVESRVTFDAEGNRIEYRVIIADSTRYQPFARIDLREGKILP